MTDEREELARWLDAEANDEGSHTSRTSLAWRLRRAAALLRGQQDNTTVVGRGPFCEDCGKPIDDGARKWADDVWTCSKCSEMHAAEAAASTSVAPQQEADAAWKKVLVYMESSASTATELNAAFRDAVRSEIAAAATTRGTK